MKKRFILILLVCVLTLALCACRNKTIYDIYIRGNEYTSGNREYNGTLIKNIKVYYMYGSVEFIKSDNDSLNITENSLDLKDGEKFHSLVDGDTLYIRFSESGYVGKIDEDHKNLKVEINENVNIDIECKMTNITFDDHELGTLNINDTAGNIYAGYIKVNDLDIHSLSGNINISKIDGQDTYIQSTSGGLKIDEINGETTYLRSVSGAIKVKRISSNTTEISTSSGNISLNSIKGDKYVIDSESGSIECDLANLNTLNMTTKSGSIDCLVAGGSNLNFTTSSGNIDLTLTKNISFDLAFLSTTGRLHTSMDYTLHSDTKKYSVGEGNYVVGVSAKSISGSVNLSDSSISVIPLFVNQLKGEITEIEYYEIIDAIETNKTLDSSKYAQILNSLYNYNYKNSELVEREEVQYTESIKYIFKNETGDLYSFRIYPSVEQVEIVEMYDYSSNTTYIHEEKNSNIYNFFKNLAE